MKKLYPVMIKCFGFLASSAARSLGLMSCHSLAAS